MSPERDGRMPIGAKIKGKIGNRASKLRNRPGKRLKEKAPNPPNRNLSSSTVTGATAAGVVTILEETVGIPFGASVDITDVQTGEDGDVYTINVNSPTRNMAEARAFMDSSTGFASYLTDIYDVEGVEVLNKRPLRDTYQFKLRIKR